MKIIENALTDRGSKYAVSGGAVSTAAEAKAFVKQLCRKKKFAKATHNTWAVVLPDSACAGRGADLFGRNRGVICVHNLCTTRAQQLRLWGEGGLKTHPTQDFTRWHRPL